MRLDAVFVVAPKPQPPSMPTRRAFLIAGSTFATGALLGGACGYSIGAAMNSSSSTASPAAEPELVPSGDVELDELRRLAVKAPIEELVEKAPRFLQMRVQSYKGDEILWKGVDRLSREMIANPTKSASSTLAAALIVTIESGGYPASLRLQDHLPGLRTLRASLRQNK